MERHFRIALTLSSNIVHAESRRPAHGLTGPGSVHRIGSGVRTTEYELLTIRHGMIVRIREFYDKAEALEAAGLSE
jgi:hypothetical protein